MTGRATPEPRRRGRGALLAALIVTLLAAAFPAAARAAMIPVTTFTDENADNDTCSLREAVKSATLGNNTHEGACTAGSLAGTDTIILTVGTYTLAGPAGENGNVGGDLDFIDGPIAIQGTAGGNGVPTTTIDGNNVDRILDLQDDPGIVDVTVNDVILRNGMVGIGVDGGAVRIDGPDSQFEITRSKVLNSDAGHYGGAIYFEGGDASSSVTIEQSEFSGNTAGSEGGALWVDQHYDGDFDVLRSTFTANSADMGGAIYLGTRPDSGIGPDGVQMDMTNSTISGNSASQAGGAIAFDAADSGNAFIFNSTIADNTSTPAGSGGAVFTNDTGVLDAQFVYFGSSIVANNRAGGVPSNCAGTGATNFQTAGWNIESANSCEFNPGSANPDLINTNPLLAPLAVNAGGALTTRTRALFNESPAVNRIPVVDCASADGEDQRGVARPVGGSCDVGAFEGSIGPVPRCAGRIATLFGTSGKNTIVGTNGPDVIAGLGGNDTIKGKGGKDFICGNGGKDKLVGGAGKDTLIGAAGRDRLIGGKGRDKLLGGKGRDRLRGGPGRDKLRGGPGRDRQRQ